MANPQAAVATMILTTIKYICFGGLLVSYSLNAGYRKVISLPPMQRIVRLHKYLYETLSNYPGFYYVTDILFYCIVCFASDIVEQTFEKLKNGYSYDMNRSWKMTLTGISVGTVCHLDYKIVEYLIPGDSNRRAFVKMMVGTVYSMPAEVFVFFFTLTVENWDFSRETMFQEVFDKSLSLFYTELMIWPIFHILNFRFVKPAYRTITDGMFAFCCDIFASYFAYSRPSPM